MKTTAPIDCHNALAAVIQFASFAAFQAVDLARFCGEDPDPEICMGLWQSFRSEFPKESYPGDYDLAIRVLSEVYRRTVEGSAVLA
jgi:hypothetical protein